MGPRERNKGECDPEDEDLGLQEAGESLGHMFSGQKQAVTLMPENLSSPHVSQTPDPTPTPGSVEMTFPSGDLRAQHTPASETLLPPSAPRPPPPPSRQRKLAGRFC